MSIRLITKLIATALAASTGPAAVAHIQAASASEDANCIMAAVGPAANERIFSFATAPDPDSEAMAAIVIPAATRFFEERDWNRGQLERATMEAMTTITARHATGVLARANIRVATLDRWFGTLSPAMRATMELTTIADLALAQALIADGVTDERREANQRAIGGYLAYLMVRERIAQGLPLIPE